MAGGVIHLKRIWEAWKVLAHKIGTFQARVLLTILFATVTLPFGLLVRLFSDPLRIRKVPQQWLPRDEHTDMEWARKQ